MPDHIATPPDGLTGNYDTGNSAYNITIIIFFAIALYNSLELIVLIFMTFHRFRGLYFWSLLLSSVVGVIPHVVGYIVDLFKFGPRTLALAIETVGFYFMVPGQSIVLYSRLHLVHHNTKTLRFILCFIIIGSATAVIPTTVATFGSVVTKKPTFIHAYNIIERYQVTWFCVQEFLLGALYIFETIKLHRLSPQKSVERELVMYELIAINVIMIGMDAAMLALEYSDLYVLQVTLKSAIYSIKLKLEFAVLGRLILFIHPSRFQPNDTQDGAVPNFVNTDRLTGDVTHALSSDVELRSRFPWATSRESISTSTPRQLQSGSATNGSGVTPSREAG